MCGKVERERAFLLVLGDGCFFLCGRRAVFCILPSRACSLPNVSLTCASSSAFWLAYHLPHSASRQHHDSSANWRGCCYNLTQLRHCLHLVQSTTCRYRLALLPPLRLLLRMALVLLLLLLLPLLILFLLLFMFCFCWLLAMLAAGAAVVGFIHEPHTRPQNCMRGHGNISLRVPEADEPRTSWMERRLCRMTSYFHLPEYDRILCEADKRRIPADYWLRT